ncbi:MAG: carbohydrate ABC transporter permease [Ostreibacterium sp.]
MSTIDLRRAGRLMLTPSVIILLAWMIIPLGMTIYFSTLGYNLLMPDATPFVGWDNYKWFFQDPDFSESILNTLLLVVGVLFISIIGGILFALLLEQPIFGKGIARILVISPFFVMPTVSALVWKNMFFNPVNGLFAYVAHVFGLPPYDFLTHAPLFSMVIIVAWQWLPFAALIFITSLQSLDSEQMEAAEMDGAGKILQFFYIVLPHLMRSITIVILIQSIFLLSIFAEIFVTTSGGPGAASSNLTFLIYKNIFQQNDVGVGAAGGIVAVVLANMVAFFLIRIVGKNLEA